MLPKLTSDHYNTYSKFCERVSGWEWYDVGAGKWIMEEAKAEPFFIKLDIQKKSTLFAGLEQLNLDFSNFVFNSIAISKPGMLDYVNILYQLSVRRTYF